MKLAGLAAYLVENMTHPKILQQLQNEWALGCPDVLFMRGFLFLKMQMPGKKRSKIGYLARLFNAADAFSGAKSTRKSNCPDTLALKIFIIKHTEVEQIFHSQLNHTMLHNGLLNPPLVQPKLQHLLPAVPITETRADGMTAAEQ
ncbi:hypothetical protein LVJ83_01855 [Uruburuella testudinis]|uniref:Uncharacterized protein n=1 Tax=Uruburuella testudinis TaxID=1282863 RepID=A0ABY4DT72_9NEIS|nr:hypothetical protein [Uruburuella testudinis]UOO82246.1 hypothetical protein LVJ83_01855 [Uruburuella testudinis]